MNGSDSQTSSNSYYADIGYVDVDGGYAIDLNANLPVSFQYTDENSLSHWYSFITSGQLGSVIPPGAVDPKYTPLGVLK